MQAPQRAVRAAAWLALCCLARPAAAQQASAQEIGPALASRERLQEALARFEHDGHSRALAALIRTRLDSGDFQVGDRVLVRVAGERELSDTFTVGPGPELALPQLGALGLSGVLRSELQGRLETHLQQYLRDPVVQVRPLLRFLVEGEVARPGFYAVAPEQPLADVITAAGGLTQRAKPTGIRVERGRDRIWSGDQLQLALGRGYSIDQLNLRAGDHVVVPARRESGSAVRWIGALTTIPVAVFALIHIF